MNKEIWKNIPGYEGYYQASDQGRIKSLKKIVKRWHTPAHEFIKMHYPEKILKSIINNKNYNVVSLSINGNVFSKKISCLILLTFVSPKPKGKEASHLNGNSLDDRSRNLEWETHKENINKKKEHGTLQNQKGEKNNNSILTNKNVLKIRKMLKDGSPPWKIAKKFKVTEATISLIKTRRSWKHLK